MGVYKVGALGKREAQGGPRVEGRGVENGFASSAGGGTGKGVGSAIVQPGSVGAESEGRETSLSQARGVPREGNKTGEASGRSNARFARGPVEARATEYGLAKTAGPGITRPFLSTKTQCYELALEIPFTVPSEAEVSLFRLTVGVDAGVRECGA